MFNIYQNALFVLFFLKLVPYAGSPGGSQYKNLQGYAANMGSKISLLRSVAASRGTWGHLPPQLEALPPHLPPSQKVKMVKISHFWQIFGFFASSEMHFAPQCPPNAPHPQKHFWCRHCLGYEWPLIKCKIWYINGSIFQNFPKFELKLAQIWENFFKKLGDFNQHFAQNWADW